ncbi:MAG: hypothetical protein ACXVW9_10975 [Nocardioidaceae bacterium]
MPDSEERVREALLEALLEKVESENYPSSTILNTIESLLTPESVPRYAAILIRGIQDSRFPSISMIHRLQALGGR